MSRPRVATIGCGFFSQFHHDAWQRLEVELAGICDLDAQRASDFCQRYGGARAFTDFDAMLDACRPDLVDIILPPALHLEHLQKAVGRVPAVICQKPFCENLEQARGAVAIAAQNGTTLVVHENFRFQPWYRVIRSILERGDLGRIYQLRFDLRPGDGQGKNAYLDRQPYFQQMTKFLVKETAVHFIDVFRYLCGEPSSVWADLRQLNTHISGEDAGLIVLEFGDDLRAVFDGNRLSDHPARNHRLTMGEFLVEGEHGTLKMNGNAELTIRPRGEEHAVPVDYRWNDRGFGGDCVYLTQKHVVDHLANGSPLENTAADYLANLEIQERIYRSSELGQRLSTR